MEGEIDQDLFGKVMEASGSAVKCDECGESISSGTVYGNEKGTTCCQQCMEKKADKCVHCAKPLLSQYVSVGGSKWHRECYDEKFRCAACQKPTYGDAVSNAGQSLFWHSACFLCAHCQQPLQGGYIMRDNDAYCTECGRLPVVRKRELPATSDEEKSVATATSTATSTPAATTTSTTTTTTTTLTTPTNDGNVAATPNSVAAPTTSQAAIDEFYENVQHGKSSCGKCGKVIGATAEAAYEWEGSVYHPQCFVCVVCSSPIAASEGFCQRNGQPCCTQCFNAAKPKAGYCGECGKPLVSSYLMVKGAKFHKECFVCDNCHQPFGTAGYAEIDGRPWCAQCVRQRTPTPQPATGRGRGGGFVVDPRTGEKRYTPKRWQRSPP
jgi:LIM domain